MTCPTCPLLSLLNLKVEKVLSVPEQYNYSFEWKFFKDYADNTPNNLNDYTFTKDPGVILFSDKKTFLVLNEQDYHDFHDCDKSARLLSVVVNPELWSIANQYFPEAIEDF